MSLIRFSFQNNHGNQSSVEPYYSPQSDELNSDDTIFRGSHRSCSLKRKTPVLESLFSQKKVCNLLKEEKHTLHSMLERTKLIRYTVMFLSEMFIQNLVLKFFGPKKIKCKTRKRHI